MVPSLLAKSNAADNADVVVWADPSTHRLLVNASVSISGGSLSNNNAAPGSTNIGVLPAVANAAAQSWTEGNQVLLSVDLSGNLRTSFGGSLPAGTNVIGHVIVDSGTITTVGTVSTVTAVTTVSTVTAVTTVATVTNLAQMNGAAILMGNGVTGTGSQRVTIASDNTPFPIKLDQTTPGTTNAVALAQIGATTVVTAGVNGTLAVGGNVATNVAIGTNPINNGAQAVSSENSAVTTGRMVQLVADLVGKLIVLPYSNPENFVSGVTAAMTGTTSTSLLAAPASGLRNYVTHIIVTNSHATVGTFILIQDGSGGTTLYEAYAVATGGGFSITFPVPLRQPTTATALFVQNVTTGSNTIASASGYKGA